MSEAAWESPFDRRAPPRRIRSRCCTLPTRQSRLGPALAPGQRAALQPVPLQRAHGIQSSHSAASQPCDDAAGGPGAPGGPSAPSSGSGGRRVPPAGRLHQPAPRRSLPAAAAGGGSSEGSRHGHGAAGRQGGGSAGCGGGGRGRAAGAAGAAAAAQGRHRQVEEGQQGAGATHGPGGWLPTVGGRLRGVEAVCRGRDGRESRRCQACSCARPSAAARPYALPLHRTPTPAAAGSTTQLWCCWARSGQTASGTCCTMRVGWREGGGGAEA